MTQDDQNQENGETPERTSFRFEYENASEFSRGEDFDSLNLYANIRGPESAYFRGKVKKPALFRAAMEALFETVQSDQRRVMRDRTAYLAYKAAERRSSLKNAMESRQEYFEWLEKNDPDAFAGLDPLISVYSDCVMFEVFSKDEGVYASLQADSELFDSTEDIRPGTTNIDFSKELYQGLQKMRSFRETLFVVSERGASLAVQSPKQTTEILEKKASIPDSWIRGFLQVQSAGLLERKTFRISPMDLYNVIRRLRLHADLKNKGRAIRVELIPGRPPRLALEPWEFVITTSAKPYDGAQPEIIRLWGRRRLDLFTRLLPFAESVDVHLLGAGLPSFFVLKAGPIRFTLCLSGFTSENWARTISLDLLLPRDDSPAPEGERVLEFMKERRRARLDEIASELNLDKGAALRALQEGCRRGLLMYDLEFFRFRPLSRDPLPMEKFQYRNARERAAYGLLESGAALLEQATRAHDGSLEVTGNVRPSPEAQAYRVLLVLNEEGGARKAECTCSFYRKNQLKKGPCEHIIALGLLQKRESKNEDRNPARETRWFSLRRPEGETIYRVSLQEKKVLRSWGIAGGKTRKQNLIFNNLEDSRAAYIAQLERLRRKGCLEMTR